MSKSKFQQWAEAESDVLNRALGAGRDLPSKKWMVSFMFDGASQLQRVMKLWLENNPKGSRKELWKFLKDYVGLRQSVD